MSLQPLRQLVVTIRLTGCPTCPVNDSLCQTLTSFCLFVCFCSATPIPACSFGAESTGTALSYCLSDILYLFLFKNKNKNSIQKSKQFVLNALATWKVNQNKTLQ